MLKKRIEILFMKINESDSGNEKAIHLPGFFFADELFFFLFFHFFLHLVDFRRSWDAALRITKELYLHIQLIVFRL